jgi:flagellar biosynthesis/type III secretory pathway protein FliH
MRKVDNLSMPCLKRLVDAQPLRLGIDEVEANEEDDVSAEIRAWFEDYQRKLRDEGLQEGLKEGRKEGECTLLLRLLRARFGELSAAVVARINAAEAADLERWGERVLAAQTLAEVFADPS